MRFEIDRHVVRELVDARFLRAIGRAMHVAAGAEGGGEGDQPRFLLDHHRGGVPARDIGRAQSDVEDLHRRKLLFPEGRRRNELVMDIGGVVHKDVEPPRIRPHPFEKRRDLRIVGVIAGNRNAPAARRRHRRGGFMDGPRQRRAVPPRRMAAIAAAAGDIDCHPLFAETDRNALARAAAGARHDGDCRICHVTLPIGPRLQAVTSALTISKSSKSGFAITSAKWP